MTDTSAPRMAASLQFATSFPNRKLMTVDGSIYDANQALECRLLAMNGPDSP
jgi:hypothetical protein